MSENSIVSLNLVMTYPISWSLSHIMEDYIQNFYDVLGPDELSKEFLFSYDAQNHVLRMESQKGFCVEWLKYIGASTKKGSNQSYGTAGKFGEGFKMASLCAFRDQKLSIHMESMDWTLDVAAVSGMIDRQKVDFLGYDIKKRTYADNAVLILGNVSPEAFQVFRRAMQSFYYPENPVFGERIAVGYGYAVYRRKAEGESKEKQVDGKLFASMQERAEIRNVPLIFCNHGYEPVKEDDRDRDRFSSRQIEEAVADVVRRLEGRALQEVFLAFRPYWCRPGGWRKQGPDWRKLMERMVWWIAEDSEAAREIRDYLREDYIADEPPYAMKADRNRYRTAGAWFRGSEFYGRYQILPHYFSRLGLESLYTLCEKNDGFHVIREPDSRQKQWIHILEKMALDVFGDLLCYEKLPKCRVIVNRETPNEGFAMTSDSTAPASNRLGLKVVSEISDINLREELFADGQFPKAMAVYMHELLHQFGSDTSGQFRAAILALDYRIMQKGTELEEYERMWGALS